RDHRRLQRQPDRAGSGGTRHDPRARPGCVAGTGSCRQPGPRLNRPVLIAAGMGAAGAWGGRVLAPVARRRPPGAAAACSGRSACDHCGTTLRAPDLVPIVSRFLLRGRCRHCGGPIPLMESWVELAAALVAVAVVLLAGPSSWPWLLLAGWLLVLLAAIDHL